MDASSHETLTTRTSPHTHLLTVLLVATLSQAASACVDPPAVKQQDQGADAPSDPEHDADMAGAPDAEMDASDQSEMGAEEMDLSGGVDDARCDQEIMPGSTQRFQAGQGVAGDPYLICTPNQLLLIAVEEKERVDAPMRRPGAFYALGKDILLDPGRTWTPIPCFRGDLDGAGHRVVNLTIKAQSGASGCYDTNFERVGGFIHNFWGKLHDISFEEVKIGTELVPMPAFLGQTQSPYNHGGLFGNMVSASLTDVKVKGLEAFVTWSFGGLSHTIVNSSLERVTMEEITIHHGHGRVGGLAVLAQNTTPNGLIFNDLSFNATITQDENIFGTVTQTTSTPVGLLVATLHGAATIARLTLGGSIQHDRTHPEQDTILGGVAALTFDQLPTDTPPETIEALRTRKLLVTNLTLRGFTISGCQPPSMEAETPLHALPCRTSGALFGVVGRPLATRGPLSSPIHVERALIQDTTMTSANPGLLIGSLYAHELMLESVEIRDVDLVPTTIDQVTTDADCLWARTLEDGASEGITTTDICIEQSTCLVNTPASSQTCAP